MTSLKFQYDDLMNPVLQAIRELGGSGNNEEINTKVVEIANVPADQSDILHDPSKGGMTEIEYRLMWTRTYLKKFGIIENSARGVWALTAKGSSIDKVDEKEVVRVVRDLMKKEKDISKDEEPDQQLEWQTALLDVIQKMSPDVYDSQTSFQRQFINITTVE